MRIVPVLLNDRETKPTYPPISNQWQSILARVIVVRQSGLRRIKSPSIATVPSQLATLDTQISLSFAAMLFLTLVFGSWWSLLTKSESLVASQSWLYSIFDNSKKKLLYMSKFGDQFPVRHKVDKLSVLCSSVTSIRKYALNSADETFTAWSQNERQVDSYRSTAAKWVFSFSAEMGSAVQSEH